MKKLILLSLSLVVFAAVNVQAQKYFTRNGHIWFFSHAPAEDIEAHNYQANSILDASSGEMVFSVLMKGFEFEKALMQEHFNEKYVHSSEFPKAQFQGKVVDISKVDFKKPGVYDVVVKGDLTIHGVTKAVESPGTLEVTKDGKVLGKAKFPVTVADYDIEVPAVVRENIAKVVDVNVDMNYEPYNK